MFQNLFIKSRKLSIKYLSKYLKIDFFTKYILIDSRSKLRSNKLFFFMSCSVTSVFTFKIESTFDEWAAIFDSAEADKRHSEFDIKPLFRGVSKDDPQRIIVIHQAPEGNVQKFVEANGDWMATHRVDLSTMEESSWTASLTKDDSCD